MSVPPRRGKGKIKPPRTLIATDARSQDIWKKLSHNIREIQNHNASRLSFEENYRFAYNMVSAKQGRTLYEGTKTIIVENLDRLAKTHIVPTFPVGTEEDTVQDCTQGEQLLKAFRFVWDDHISSMTKLRDILKYMDRVHSQAEGVPQIWDAGLQLFLDRIIRSPLYSIRQHILNGVLRQIRLERDGYPVNRSAIKGCIDIYRNLIDPIDGVTVYRQELEPSILSESESYYKNEGEVLMATCDAPEYLRRVEARLQSEHQRSSHYFRITEDAIITHLKQGLITPHLINVISMPGSGLNTMIDLQQHDDLARLYTLFNLVPSGPGALKNALKASIAERGKLVNEAEGVSDDVNEMEAGPSGAGYIISRSRLPSTTHEDTNNFKPKLSSAKGKGKEKPTSNEPSAAVSSSAGAQTQGKKTLDAALKWVQDVLDLKDLFDRILKICFADDRVIQAALNEAFESFINLRPKAPEYISLFIDENLKKGLKGKSDDEVDIVLDKTITVFRFITDKDIFEKYYKGHLAKRLLSGRSVSDDAEKGMLAKLKVECGFQFTQKLEGMFHDMKISNDTMEAYQEHLAKSSNDPPPIEMSVQVLTSTFWPMTHIPTPCKFSPDMIKSCNTFERFYLARHSGRRLSWQPSLGSADVRVTFVNSATGKTRTHDLNVSTHALVILLMFESLGKDDFLTYEEILDVTSIPAAELSRNLQSLACAKFKILKKHPPGRDVDPGDSFSFNDDFSASMQRIKISTVSAKVENVAERKQTKDSIDEERNFQMEAAIVRIMKDRKHMSHNDLVNEVTRQLSSRFAPNPLVIKKRIEALLDREYLDRGDDKKSYVYVASGFSITKPWKNIHADWLFT